MVYLQLHISLYTGTVHVLSRVLEYIRQSDRQLGMLAGVHNKKIFLTRLWYDTDKKPTCNNLPPQLQRHLITDRFPQSRLKFIKEIGEIICHCTLLFLSLTMYFLIWALWRAAYTPADCQPVGVYFTPTDRQPSGGCTPAPLYSPCI